ncbi:MAG: hypothetical protein IPN33_18560 [Saprospiraceae bacterium]|nr:hypothetical protein [Saprospiraceae bacterium]
MGRPRHTVQCYQQTFQVKRTDGSSATLNLSQMLSERAQGLLDDISPKDETNNSEECNLEPLGCTPYEIQQQNSSVTSIMGQMAQLNAAGEFSHHLVPGATV